MKKYILTLIIILITLLKLIKSSKVLLNQTVLFEFYGYTNESTYIDLTSQNIYSIDQNTFNGLIHLEELHLENNELSELNETNVFNGLINLRELWLESNEIYSFDLNILNELTNLKYLCLNNNPISIFYNNQFKFKHIIKQKEKCKRNRNELSKLKIEKQLEDRKILKDINILKKSIEYIDKRIQDKFKCLEDKIDNNFNNLQLNYEKTIQNNSNQIVKIFENKLLKFQILQNYILSSNLAINELLNQGFKIVYNQSYSQHATTNDELYYIKSMCLNESILCVGGSDSNNILLLSSCGYCLNVLTTTITDQPVKINKVYWYFTPDNSFGFSLSYSIKQKGADIYDCNEKNAFNCTDSKRLSWHLGGSAAGWRIGTLTNKEYTIPLTYRKIILLLI